MILAADEDYSSSLKSSGIMATFDMKSLIAECRTFYFAGHETTTQLLTWTLMLLSTHTEWQDRARAEVVEVCGDLPLDADAISKLKIVRLLNLSMILQSYSNLFQFYINTNCFKFNYIVRAKVTMYYLQGSVSLATGQFQRQVYKFEVLRMTDMNEGKGRKLFKCEGC